MIKFKQILKLLLIFLVILIILSSLIFLYIKLTFKKDYTNLINENLQTITINNASLNKNLVLSIIKQESGFDKNAKSNSDAFGLMQLTYPTAKEMANKLGFEISLNDLFKPEINIKLGINYLNYL